MSMFIHFQAVYFKKPDDTYEILMAGPSHFSPELIGEKAVREQIIYADPLMLCSRKSFYHTISNIFYFNYPLCGIALKNLAAVKNKILVVQRGDCTFVDKARKAQAAGAKAVIVIDNVVGSSSKDMPMFAMSGDGKDDVSIPVVFLFSNDAKVLEAAVNNNTELEVGLLFQMN